MALTIDLAMRQEREFECPCCKAQVQRTWNYVSRDDEPYAVYFANCYHHRDKPHEVWIDVILGTWGEGEFDDHVTFGCRVGPVVDSPEPAATLVQACLDGSGGRSTGFSCPGKKASRIPGCQTSGRWLTSFSSKIH
jgi:hypothetical protein